MRHGLFAFLSLACTSLLSAQGGTGTISPGMSRAKVVAALGTPATERTVAEFRYLFYVNSCGKQCGMNDLVILHGDSVVDAIFRSPSRRYTGTSSSPTPISAKDAAERATKPSAKPRPAQAPATRRMKPPAEANDARPSIPSKPPTLQPSKSSSPATRTP
jgi:outer membrane protein assembly factor BamE (lipoprotein component of BamABCDE complex)